MSGKRDKRIVRPNVVGVSASPRRRGNTDVLLDWALKGARSRGAVTKKISLNDLRYKPCQGCYRCEATGLCVIRDDMRRVYRSIEDADSVIIASPIFFGGVTAQLKAMIDRFHCAWIARQVLKDGPLGKRSRRGYFLCSSDSGYRRHYLDASRMVKMLFNTIGIEFAEKVFFPGSGKKIPSKCGRGDMRRAFKLGERAAS